MKEIKMLELNGTEKITMYTKQTELLDGNYNCRIISVEKKISKANNPMLVWSLDVFTDNGTVNIKKYSLLTEGKTKPLTIDLMNLGIFDKYQNSTEYIDWKVALNTIIGTVVKLQKSTNNGYTNYNFKKN